MAFASASGYTNLPNGNFSSVIYSKKVQLAFRKKAICGDITNSDYFGEIASQGDTHMSTSWTLLPTVRLSAWLTSMTKKY
jgi:hypothetical protein